jgi:hypothetical protein
MWKLEKLTKDYHYTTQVIEFLVGLNDEKKQKNIEFWKNRLNELEDELIKELRKLTPDEIKTAIQMELLSFLTTKDAKSN